MFFLALLALLIPAQLSGSSCLAGDFERNNYAPQGTPPYYGENISLGGQNPIQKGQSGQESILRRRGFVSAQLGAGTDTTAAEAATGTATTSSGTYNVSGILIAAAPIIDGFGIVVSLIVMMMSETAPKEPSMPKLLHMWSAILYGLASAFGYGGYIIESQGN